MSQFISLQEGAEMTQTYRNERSILIDNGKVAEDLLPLYETFDKEQVQTILNRTGCVSLRLYLGMDTGKVSLILVGVDGQNRDILPTASTLTTTEEKEDYLLDRGIRCPTDCAPESDLNTDGTP